jgi:DNA polymerase-3 subunit alpha
LARHASTHAAGVVISPEPLTEFLPLYKAPNENAIITQYDMEAIETLGLLKFDFLGLKTLTVIDTTEKLINHTIQQSQSPETPDSFSVKEIPLDDRDTFNLLSSAKATGIFQLESAGMRDLLLRLKPETFEDLIALVALYRPGPLGSGMIDDFIKRKRSDVPIKYQLPQLEDILKETYGIILYQEQVMKITNVLANFSMADADLLQRALSKKKIGQMEKLKDTFISGAKKNKISEKKSEMANFAQYGFNKSHSAAYAMIAYRTAYLKAHHPVEFMAALLSADMDNTEKVVLYINECKEVGIEILPPDINESKQEFTAVGKSIRFGLEAVKGVGSSAIESIITTREQERFDSFFDFCSRVDSRKVNRKVIESLIKAGAFDTMGKRAQLLHAIDTALDIALKAQREKASGQRSMFESHHSRYPELPRVEELSESERLMMEKDALGFYITGHPLGKYGEHLKQLSVTPINKIEELPDRSDITICGIPIKLRKIQTKKTGDLMGYLTIEDLYGTTELIIFPDLYNKSAHLLTLDVPLIISGQIDKNDKGSKIITRDITSIEQLQDENGTLTKRGETLHYGAETKRNDRAVPSRSDTDKISEKTFEQQVSSKPQRKLTLTLTADSSTESLTSLKDVFSRYHGLDAVPVFLKVVFPKHWETEIETDQLVSPSEGMIADIEDIVGKGKVQLT